MGHGRPHGARRPVYTRSRMFQLSVGSEAFSTCNLSDDRLNGMQVEGRIFGEVSGPTAAFNPRALTVQLRVNICDSRYRLSQFTSRGFWTSGNRDKQFCARLWFPLMGRRPG